MDNDLRRCFVGCCRFLDNQTVTESDYEAALSRHQSILGGPLETLIACRNAGGQQKAVENAAGFFLGDQMRHAFGTLIPNGKTLVFDSSNGSFLREATEADIKKWNDAWRDFVNAQKS